jgi:ureidoglycolate amidohydrolase
VRLPLDITLRLWNYTSSRDRFWSAKGIPIGIVTNIVGPSSFFITIDGEGGHAGGVLMPDRHDALCAAAELIVRIESAARQSGSTDTVATVGICEVHPGAINSIPSRVKLGVDLRDTDGKRRDRVLSLRLSKAAQEIAQQRQLTNYDSGAECR